LNIIDAIIVFLKNLEIIVVNSRVFISFDPRDRELAETLIKELRDEGFSPQPLIYEATISVPPRLIGRIFGRGGLGILRLREQMGVEIYLELKNKGHITVRGKSKLKVSRTVSQIRAKMGPPIYPSLNKMAIPDVQVALISTGTEDSYPVRQETEEAIQNGTQLIIYGHQLAKPGPKLQLLVSNTTPISLITHEINDLVRALNNKLDTIKE
jgi:hypothetical protein